MSVDKISLIARFEFFRERERLEALFFREFFCGQSRVALGFGIVQKGFITFGELVNFFEFLAVGFFINVLSFLFQIHIILLVITFVYTINYYINRLKASQAQTEKFSRRFFEVSVKNKQKL